MVRKARKKMSGRSRQTELTVSVHAPNALPVAKASVTVVGGGRTIRLSPTTPGLYRGSVAPGTYELRATAGSLVGPRRSVTVSRAGKTACVYLGEKGWPFYRLGENAIPFEPPGSLIAFAFPGRRPSRRRARQVVQTLSKALPIRPYDLRRDKELPFAAANDSVWFFELRKAYSAELYARILAVARRELGEDVRVGIPVDLGEQRIKILDNHFVVRFREHITSEQIEALTEKAGGRVLRGFIQAGNAKLIEFVRGGWRQHLAAIESWFDQDLLIYGEPDLMAEIRDDVYPATAPDDPTFANQANLTLQRADVAWQLLNAQDPNLTLGSPAVRVTTVDRGAQLNHPDVGGNLTDGTNQIEQCWDFVNFAACTAPGYTQDSNHGMGVYGIVAALTNNTRNIAGIAPNAHQIPVRRPDLFSVNYPDVLLWAAGFVTGNATPGWPAEPIPAPTDIISCSHGADGLAISGIMDDTFQFLATYGRNGRGVLMIYSAGNGSALITGFRTWAAHPRTLAISNSNQPDGGGVERLNNTSNFGPEIDISAQGNNAPSLDNLGAGQVFGGTSASAPTVAAAAALMLSVEPALTWINLRDILRDTAIQIDAANTDPVGMWVGGFSQWYGFGRLDIADAVQGALDFDPGVAQLIARDNLADTGLVVPSGGVFWRSPDLWVRRNDPATDPIGDPAYGVDPPHESARAGVDNFIRVRVKNIGTGPSGDYFVRLYLTHFAGSQFVYPTDFIPSVHTGDPLPNPLVQATYLIGEQQASVLGAGVNAIFNFLWPAALVPPETVGGVRWHPCLLAEVSPHAGIAPSGNLIVDFTNLVQRNVTVDYADDDADHESVGVVGHKDDHSRRRWIVLHRGNAPKQAAVWVRFLDPRIEAAVIAGLDRPGQASDPAKGDSCCCGKGSDKPKRGPKPIVDRRHGRRVLRLAGDRMAIEIPMIAGPLTPVVIGMQLPKGVRRGRYECVLMEESETGRCLGAFSLQLERR